MIWSRILIQNHDNRQFCFVDRSFAPTQYKSSGDRHFSLSTYCTSAEQWPAHSTATNPWADCPPSVSPLAESSFRDSPDIEIETVVSLLRHHNPALHLRPYPVSFFPDCLGGAYKPSISGRLELEEALTFCKTTLETNLKENVNLVRVSGEVDFLHLQEQSEGLRVCRGVLLTTLVSCSRSQRRSS